MSVRLRFLSSGDAGAVGVVGRSASFAGFSSAQSRRLTKSIHGNSVRSRMPAKASKMYGTLRKGSVCPDPKPQQVKKIFEALKRGLKEYLCVQQAELDYLSGRHKDTRRNSRLAFYYDLDKQTRSVERHIRKMEFHISKVSLCWEPGSQPGFCLHPPLASREGPQAGGKGECLPGAADLALVGPCPQVLMRLGRQRWKLKGRLESDDSQTWEEEEKAFIPTLHENFEIKVTELRGLSSLAVGSVTCDITDFFTTRPQVIVVDITELGTIKLQLEVLWNPFDTESFLMSPSPIGKFSMGSRKGSLYNWTPPSTPSFRERYYLSVLQQPAQQSLLLGGPRAPSILSYLSDNDLRGPGLRSRSQELPEMDSFSSEDPRDTETSTSASTSDVGFLPLAIGPNTSIEEEAQEDAQPLGLRPEMAHLAGGSFAEQPGWRNLGIGDPELPRGSPFHDHTALGSQKEHDEGETEDRVDGPEATLERPLREVLDLLRSVDPAQPQLRQLEFKVLSLRERLQPRGARQEHASAESLMECILESFAFLNADLAPQELSLFGGCQGPRKDRTPPSPPPRKASATELTAGTLELDRLLAVHLQVCRALLQKLASPNLSTMVQECLLEEAVQQKEVLEMLSVLDFEKASKATSIEDSNNGLRSPGRAGVLVFLPDLKKTFVHRVRGKYPGQLEIACRRLLEQVVSCGGLLPGAGPPEERTVTWFQFHSYLQRHGVSDLEKHFVQLTKEVTVVEELQCAGQGKPLPQTLRAWALLQLDGTPRVCRAASARLAGAARNKSFREKALLFYTNALTENDAKLQQAACMALKHLRGIESIDQIASLCQSDLEAVRTAAREATLSFGEKGRLAFEKMDKLYLEQREEAFCQEADVEITIF
uniref:RIPOR family member 3 n=1 Tax=Ursus maritimus TaxID=29073 RepID=A0A452VJP0_URSMA